MTLKGSIHNVSENLLTTSGLSILMHDVISFPDATSDDNNYYAIELSLLQYKGVDGIYWFLFCSIPFHVLHNAEAIFLRSVPSFISCQERNTL